MKRYLFPILLILVFLLGAWGHLYSRTEPPNESPYAITFTAEGINGLLIYALPEAGAHVTVLGKEGTLISLSHTPTRLYERKEGALISYPSALLSTVTFTLLLEAHEKEGRIYLGEKQIALGDELSLGGENFSFRARFTEISAHF